MSTTTDIPKNTTNPSSSSSSKNRKPDQKKVLRSKNASLKEENQDLRDKLAKMETLLKAQGLNEQAPSEETVSTKDETHSLDKDEDKITGFTFTAHEEESKQGRVLVIEEVSVKRKRKGRKKKGKRSGGKKKSAKRKKKHASPSTSVSQELIGDAHSSPAVLSKRKARKARRARSTSVTFSATTEMPEEVLLGDKELANEKHLNKLKRQVYENLRSKSIDITRVSTSSRIKQLLQEELSRGKRSAFYLVNLSNVVEKYDLWKTLLPRVEPHYAMKCNPDPVIVQALHELGVGFDCASKRELELAFEVGCTAENIIFANPCKQEEHIDFAKEKGVTKMTFDSEEELLKIYARFPEAELVLRILPDDSNSVMPFGTKFGANGEEVTHLIKVAKRIGAKLIGVSFHVGSGCYSVDAYIDAVTLAKSVFDEAAEAGIQMTLLDIGGGYPGFDPRVSVSDEPGSDYSSGDESKIASSSSSASGVHISFTEIAHTLGPLLDELFPVDEGIRIVSEPGRFFVTTAATLAVNVVSRRERIRGYLKENIVAGSAKTPSPANKKSARSGRDSPPMPDQENDGRSSSDDDESASDRDTAVIEQMSKEVLYYLSDGIYGSFNNIIFDHATPEPNLLSAPSLASTSTPSSSSSKSVTEKSYLFGPTCDSVDVIAKDIDLPRLNVGDWLYFVNMGAYTTAAASNFNGIRPPQYHYIMSMDFASQ